MSLVGTASRLLASLDLDTKPFEAGERRVGAGLKNIDSGLGRVSTRSIAAGTAVGQGIERLAERGIGFLFDQIRSGEEGLRVLQDTTAATGAVIESTGGKAGITAAQVRSLAEAQEALTTVDDKVVQSGENMLLTFTGIGKGVFPDATKAMVDMAVAMNGGNAEGIDLKTTAIQLGKALNDPIKGVGALRKVGVQLTDQQEKQIKTFMKAGDVESAQKVILGELTKEFGKAGEAAGKSGAAGVRRLNDAVEDTQISLATGLAPALERIRTKIASALTKPETQAAIKHLGEWLGDAAESGLKFAEGIPWGQVTEGLKTAAGFAGGLVKAFTNMPPEVQGTLLALAGLNKLSGGAVTGIVGELGKGLIKGVLGMTAGVVNLKAGAVVGGGGGGVPGVPSAAGAATTGISTLGKVALVGEAIGLVAAVVAVGQAVRDSSVAQAQDIHQTLTDSLNNNPTQAALQTKLDAIDSGIAKLKADPIAAALITGPTIDELERMRADVVAAMQAGPKKPQDDSPNARDWRAKELTRLQSLDSRTADVSAYVARLKGATDQSRIAISAKVAGLNGAIDGTTRAVRAIPPPRTNVTVNTRTVVNVSAAQYARTMVQSGTWSSSQAGAYNKGSRIPGA